MKIDIDFETRSSVDLTTRGMHNYIYSPDAGIICMAYKIEEDPVQLWHPGMPKPEFMDNIKEHTLYAFNAKFDYFVWNVLGSKNGFPKTDLNNWIDVMALCGRYTFHQSLAEAGNDLATLVKKNKRGSYLMKLICMPPYKYSREDMIEFYEYCKTDVETMHEIKSKLPADVLSPLEQKAWILTAKINNTGVPIDIKAVKQILNVTNAYKEEMSKMLPSLTGGKVTKPTQSKRIVDWLKSKGVITPNLQAETVTKLLSRLDLQPNVRTVLQLRQELGKSSTAKYLKLSELCYKNRIYDNLRYYGAGTGRWSGMGFQLHNLPRSKVKDASPIIDKFYDLTIIEDNPINAAKSIIRGMICAPEGWKICAADFASIEYISLMWVVKDQEAVTKFANLVDQYVDMASFLYKKPSQEISDSERYFGKQLILGCGYGLGGVGFQAYAEARDLNVSTEEAIWAVDTFREKYNKVVKFWYACKTAAMNAVSHPGIEFKVHNCKFKLVKDRTKTIWLKLTIPSGRALYYNSPLIRDGKYGNEVSAMGINPYTKKWDRLSIIPGRFAENIIQATARDFLLHGKIKLHEAGYKLIGSVHDEVIAEVPDGVDCLDDFCKIMCTNPAWALDIPLRAEGMLEKRYRKI